MLTIYPQQALWHLTAVSRSKDTARAERVHSIFSKVKNDAMGSRVQLLISQSKSLSEQFLVMSDFPVAASKNTLSMAKDFRILHRMTPLDIMIPIQSSMSVVLPVTTSNSKPHLPFPQHPPTIESFCDQIEIMNSLQRPKKVIIYGSDGKSYLFLCKPEDDLRKDSRVMGLNAIINRLFKADPEARKRGLNIRTYGVVPLNERCGLIEWVTGTTGFRTIVIRSYKARNIYTHHTEVKTLGNRPGMSPVDIFTQIILPR